MGNNSGNGCWWVRAYKKPVLPGAQRTVPPKWGMKLPRGVQTCGPQRVIKKYLRNIVGNVNTA